MPIVYDYSKTVADLRWGQGGTGPPNLAQPPPQIFGHSSSATGWINWFYRKFRLSVVACQMMRGQAPQIFFLEPPLQGHQHSSSSFFFSNNAYFSELSNVVN